MLDMVQIDGAINFLFLLKIPFCTASKKFCPQFTFGSSVTSILVSRVIPHSTINSLSIRIMIFCVQNENWKGLKRKLKDLIKFWWFTDA